MEPSFLRHSAWVTPSSFVQKIHIVGCGAVGSNLAIKLARMGAHRFVLYDFDDVEAHNLPNQQYLPEHVGMPKVDALEKVLKTFNPQIQVEKYNEAFGEKHALQLGSGILCLAVDSLSARGQIADLARLNAEPILMTDCRMSFEYAESYLVFPLDGQSYRDWRITVVPDEKAQESPCNRQICATLVELVTAYVTHQICSFLADPSKKLKPRRLFVLDSDLHTT